jgi:thiol:disulfide interchange protein DsbC
MKRVLLLSALSLAAAPGGRAAVDTEALKATLQQRLPQVRIVAVEPSPQWPGLYEVVSDSEIAYTNADGSLMLIGKLFDTVSKRDLGHERWSELNAIDFSALPFDRAIRVVRGDGSRQLAVFADPDCPYCAELERELLGIDNVTISVFLFPLTAVHPEAKAKAERIWCAEDRATAWVRWMTENMLPEVRDCGDTPIAEVARRGAELRISSTPTLFLADGHRVGGAVSRAELETLLAAHAAPKAP